MARKRKVIPIADSYKCSVCNFEDSNYNKCDQHILIVHNGQALINNEENRPMTDSEILSGFNRALKVLKVLKCSSCSKTFRTGLGLKFHIEICGKDESEIFKECEICGKRLRIHSVATHMKMIHLNDEGDNEPPVSNVEELKADTNNSSRKRHSAIKAMKSFKEIDKYDDNDETDKPKSNKQKLKNLDKDFEIKHSDDESEKLEDETEEEDDEIDDELEESELEQEPDNDLENDENILMTIPIKDLDIMLLALKNYIGKVLPDNIKEKFPNFETKLLELEGDAKQNDSECDNRYSCYNKRCPRKFQYRIELENHYRKCCHTNYYYNCLMGTNCEFKVKSLNHYMFQHFYQKHLALISTLKLEHCFSTYNYIFEKRRYQEDIKPRFYNICKELVPVFLRNSRQSTYRCLVPLRSHWTHSPIRANPKFLAQLSPRFKSTQSMDSGDNQFKFVAPLHGQRINSDCMFFNVGQSVSAAAWCPQPLRSEFTNFSQISNNEMKRCRRQYLAIATTSHVDLLNNESSEESYLQLWDMGSLLVSVGEQSETRQDLPLLAFNIEHNYGDILEMSWCPYGTTYEDDPANLSKNTCSNHSTFCRLGLLAIACEDGRVRILAIPHPKQVENSYNLSIVFNVKPVITLEHRFNSITLCNTISWQGEWPQDKILAGFNDGYICMWQLTALANCAPSDSLPCKDCLSVTESFSVKKPVKIFENYKKNPLFSVRWMNKAMFVSTSIENCRVWHISHSGFYAELNRCMIQKIDTYPLWHNSVILSELLLAGSVAHVFLKSFSKDFCSISRNGSLGISNKNSINDISVSTWMFMLAYCTENGELYTTKLNRPKASRKKVYTYLVYNIRLGNLIQFDSNKMDEDSKIDDEDEEEPREKHSQTGDGIVARSKPNSLVNETVDLQYTHHDFLLKYCFIFNDQEDIKKTLFKKPLSMGRKASLLLTKNDLYRHYAITQCAWNPNISSYSWLFTATKSGLCRLTNVNVINPSQV